MVIEQFFDSLVQFFSTMPWSGIGALFAIGILIRLLEGDFRLSSRKPKSPPIPVEDDEDYEWVLRRRRR